MSSLSPDAAVPYFLYLEMSLVLWTNDVPVQFSFLFIVFVLGLFAHTQWGEIDANLSHLQYFFKFIFFSQQYAEPWKTALTGMCFKLVVNAGIEMCICKVVNVRVPLSSITGIKSHITKIIAKLKLS